MISSGFLTGDEEEARRLNSRFARVTGERAEEQLDTDVNSLAAASIVDKVI